MKLASGFLVAFLLCTTANANFDFHQLGNLFDRKGDQPQGMSRLLGIHAGGCYESDQPSTEVPAVLIQDQMFYDTDEHGKLRNPDYPFTYFKNESLAAHTYDSWSTERIREDASIKAWLSKRFTRRENWVKPFFEKGSAVMIYTADDGRVYRWEARLIDEPQGTTFYLQSSRIAPYEVMTRCYFNVALRSAPYVPPTPPPVVSTPAYNPIAPPAIAAQSDYTWIGEFGVEVVTQGMAAKVTYVKSGSLAASVNIRSGDIFTRVDNMRSVDARNLKATFDNGRGFRLYGQHASGDSFDIYVRPRRDSGGSYTYYEYEDEGLSYTEYPSTTTYYYRLRPSTTTTTTYRYYTRPSGTTSYRIRPR